MTSYFGSFVFLGFESSLSFIEHILIENLNTKVYICGKNTIFLLYGKTQVVFLLHWDKTQVALLLLSIACAVACLGCKVGYMPQLCYIAVEFNR